MRNTQQNTNVFRKLRSSWQKRCKAGMRSVASRLLTLLSRVLAADLLHLPQVLQVLLHLRSHPNLQVLQVLQVQLHLRMATMGHLSVANGARGGRWCGFTRAIIVVPCFVFV